MFVFKLLQLIKPFLLCELDDIFIHKAKEITKNSFIVLSNSEFIKE